VAMANRLSALLTEYPLRKREGRRARRASHKATTPVCWAFWTPDAARTVARDTPNARTRARAHRNMPSANYTPSARSSMT
jgi:hypothetical protein